THASGGDSQQAIALVSEWIGVLRESDEALGNLLDRFSIRTESEYVAFRNAVAHPDWDRVDLHRFRFFLARHPGVDPLEVPGIVPISLRRAGVDTLTLPTRLANALLIERIETFGEALDLGPEGLS